MTNLSDLKILTIFLPFFFYRGKITKILGIGGKPKTILDELGISTGKVEATFKCIAKNMIATL